MKIYLMKFSIFTEEKNLFISHGQVFVMGHMMLIQDLNSGNRTKDTGVFKF